MKWKKNILNWSEIYYTYMTKDLKNKNRRMTKDLKLKSKAKNRSKSDKIWKKPSSKIRYLIIVWIFAYA